MSELRQCVINISSVLLDALSNAVSEFEIDKDQILKAAMPVQEKLQGVYFFVDVDEVVYVGQSKNVHARVLGHTGNAWFDQAFNAGTLHLCYLPVSDELELDLIESFYIQKFRPRGNRNKRGPIGREQLAKRITGKLASHIDCPLAVRRVNEQVQEMIKL